MLLKDPYTSQKKVEKEKIFDFLDLWNIHWKLLIFLIFVKNL